MEYAIKMDPRYRMVFILKLTEPIDYIQLLCWRNVCWWWRGSMHPEVVPTNLKVCVNDDILKMSDGDNCLCAAPLIFK